MFAKKKSSQNSKGKYESRKILDFVKKIRKIGVFFLNVLISFIFFFYFIIILNVSYYFGIF
jgi:hypothetical protein